MKLFYSYLLLLAILFSFISNFSFAQNISLDNYREAKNKLAQIYLNNPITFYCSCTFSIKSPDWNSCGYKPRKNIKRASRIEWEHIVPASEFGRTFTSWKNGHPKCITSKGKHFKGRRCAQKVSHKFRLMQSDLYNIQPSIGEVNEVRSNYPFGEILGEKREFGFCDVEVKNKIFEPPPNRLGDIARTYLYMDLVYPNRNIFKNVSRNQINQWNESDPVDEWECMRASLIKTVQDSSNPIVEKVCFSP